MTENQEKETTEIEQIQLTTETDLDDSVMRFLKEGP